MSPLLDFIGKAGMFLIGAGFIVLAVIDPQVSAANVNVLLVLGTSLMSVATGAHLMTAGGKANG